MGKINAQPSGYENTLCIIPKLKWQKEFPLQQKFLQEIQFAGCGGSHESRYML